MMTNDEKRTEIVSNNHVDIISDDEEDEHRDEHQQPLIESTTSADNAIPLSIGKIKIFRPRRRRRSIYLRKYLTVCVSLLFLIFIVTYVIKLKRSLLSPSNYKSSLKTATCDRLITLPLWNSTFPMLTIESALRLVDVNNDSILDVIVPFGTGIDAAYYKNELCQIYFNQTEDDYFGCGGGVMALDGRSGRELWRRYTPHELFASNCEVDLNDDNVIDCILGGRMASLYAIDGQTGNIIWFVASASGDPISETSNFYTPLYIPRDIDADGVPEIVVMHGGDPLRKPNERTRISAKLIVMSAKKGSILTWSVVPDGAESYYSPQLLVHPDGTLLILFGSGGETHPGSLYVISFDDLLQGQMKKARLIYKDCCKGVMVPPVLIDINKDDILDIVMSLFNSTVIAFDGLTFQVLWRTEFAGSETYSTPAVGFFNNDSIPDFAVLYQFGPGFPVYYRAQLSILDGQNGKNLLKNNVDMLIGTQSSPLTVSTLTANDIFLFWYSTCETNPNKNNSVIDDPLKAQQFKIAPGTTVHDNSRADFCRLRFNSSLYTQLRAVSPTAISVIYDSRQHIGENPRINYTEMASKWIADHTYSNDDNYPNIPASEFEKPLYQPSYQEYQPNSQIPDNYYPSYDRPALDYNLRFKHKNRFKRHVGLHDGGGVQRVISTGTLSPPLTRKLSTIDLIFGTYWFPPSRNVHLMSPEVEDCISRYMDPDEETRLRLEDKSSIFKQLDYDHDAYEEAVKEICAQTSQTRSPPKASKRQNLIKEMGAMTVYRVNLKCVSDTVAKLDDISIKEYNDQWWPSYMGRDANSVANVHYN